MCVRERESESESEREREQERESKREREREAVGQTNVLLAEPRFSHELIHSQINESNT